jgi:hypothetical protein
MNRRKFIRVLGGGIVLGANKSSLADEMPTMSIRDWAGPASGMELRRWALSYALLAPNPHNLQPWLVDLKREGEITLYCDSTRLLPQTDPFGRQILVGHGCFLELLQIALAERGVVGDLVLFPEGEPTMATIGQKPVARLVLRSGATRDPLFASIVKRHTAKVLYDTQRSVTLDAVQPMRAAASHLPVRFGVALDPANLSVLRKLCMDAAKVEISTERTMMESMRLLRIGPKEINQHRDGISINDTGMRILSMIGMVDKGKFPLPGSTAHNKALVRFEEHCSTAMGFAWLSTPDNSRASQVHAGRAYGRMQLASLPTGLGMHPMSQALQEFPEMASLHREAHRLLLQSPAPNKATDPTVQMLVRLGYPKENARPTPRRGLEAIMRG